MENNLRDNELIQRYLDRSATNEEKQEVEYRLKEEPALQSLYKEHRLLVLGIRYGHLQNKLQQLKALERALPKSSASGIPNGNVRRLPVRLRWVPLSAAAGLLIALSLWFLASQDTTPLNERLFVRHFEPFDSPGSGLTRSSENEITLKAQAYEAYDAGQYLQAAGLFEQALMEKDDAIMHLCLGNAWLREGQPEKAEEVFQHILNEHSDLVTQAKWYLALTYLKEGKMERTKATLWEISDSSTYGEKARKLLKDLD